MNVGVRVRACMPGWKCMVLVWSWLKNEKKQKHNSGQMKVYISQKISNVAFKGQGGVQADLF